MGEISSCGHAGVRVAEQLWDASVKLWSGGVAFCNKLNPCLSFTRLLNKDSLLRLFDPIPRPSSLDIEVRNGFDIIAVFAAGGGVFFYRTDAANCRGLLDKEHWCNNPDGGESETKAVSYIEYSGYMAELPCLKLTVALESIGELISFGCKFLLVLDDGLLKPLLVPDPLHPVLLGKIVAPLSFSLCKCRHSQWPRENPSCHLQMEGEGDLLFASNDCVLE